MNQPALVHAILSLVPTAMYPRDFTVDADGIATWNLTTPQPSAEDVREAYERAVQQLAMRYVVLSA